jgi:hypothetical protein
MKVAVYNGLPFHYEDIGHISEYCKLRGHDIVVYSKVEGSWGWFDYYGISPFPVETYNHKEFDYVFLLTDDDWSFPLTPDEKIICIDHASYQRRSGDIKRVTFKHRPGVPHIYFTFSVPKAPKTLRVCVLGACKTMEVKYPVEVVYIHRGKPIDATEMMKVISSCQYMALLNSTKTIATSGSISMAFTCGCRLITNKNIIDEYGLKSAIDYDATDELVSMEDTTDIYEESERMIEQRNHVYDSLMPISDYDLLKPIIDKHLSKIKAIVDATGEPCEGNVFWLHFDPEHQVMSNFLSKRINLFNYSQKAQSIMEIGFNAGHSSLLYMLSNPTSTLQLFDLGAHSYTRACFDYLSSQFPNRMKIQYGDSCQTVPAYIAENTGKVFDMIHIDGGHDEYVVQSDILNSIQLSDGKTVIISDDDEQEHIARLNRKYFEALSDALPSEYQYVGKIISPPPGDYDFIEIGTGDFDTEIQDAGLKRGISIEPVKRYLDALPNPPHVTKIHGAVSNRSGTVDVYSISPENIQKHNLSYWLRGCNSVNTHHILWDGKVPDEIIIKDRVPAYTFSDIVSMCHVKSCKYLKIDTEGHDLIILESYLDCVSNGFPLVPKIQFEANEWIAQPHVDAMLEKLVGYGYTWERTPCGTNIILVR